MGYNLLVNGVDWGYNPLILTWDIQVSLMLPCNLPGRYGNQRWTDLTGVEAPMGGWRTPMFQHMAGFFLGGEVSDYIVVYFGGLRWFKFQMLLMFTLTLANWSNVTSIFGWVAQPPPSGWFLNLQKPRGSMISVKIDKFMLRTYHKNKPFIWSNYSDLTRPGPPNGGEK